MVNIKEILNPHALVMAPIKEKQDIYIPDIIDQNIPRRNGFVSIYNGSGGSGKSSLMLNMFENVNMYKKKFHNIYYICPLISFLSVKKHPFEKHDKVYHDLTEELLEEIFQELNAIKDRAEERDKKRKKKALEKRKGGKKTSYIDADTDDESELDEEDDEDDIQYSCIVIDDFADALKDKEIQRQLSRMLIKARHICCSFIFTLQSYFYFPKILRKQITNLIIFKPKNMEEWDSIAKEVLKWNKEDGMILYDYVFDAQYKHLDVDTLTNAYYKNFNLLEII